MVGAMKFSSQRLQAALLGGLLLSTNIAHGGGIAEALGTSAADTARLASTSAESMVGVGVVGALEIVHATLENVGYAVWEEVTLPAEGHDPAFVVDALTIDDVVLTVGPDGGTK